MAVVGIDHDGAFVARDVVVVVEVQRVGELGFQAWVTLRDIERVGVVGDVEQLGDVRLLCVAAILQAQCALVAEVVVEVKCRRQVGDVADGVDVDPTVVLNVVRVLGLHEEAQVVVILLLFVAQHEPQVVGVVLVLGETAERTVEEGSERVGGVWGHRGDMVEPGVPVAVFGLDTGKRVHGQMAEVIGLAVALVLVVAQLVAGLQVGTLPQGFAVGDITHVAVAVARRKVVPGGVVSGVLSCLVLLLEEVYFVVRRIALLVASATGLDAQHDVTSLRIQSAVEL